MMTNDSTPRTRAVISAPRTDREPVAVLAALFDAAAIALAALARRRAPAGGAGVEPTRLRTTVRAAGVGAARSARRNGGAVGSPWALGAWAALVDRRWTLIDAFDRGGRRFLLARE